MGVDRKKVDDALEVLELPESAFYDVDEREYVRKAEVDEDRKETRLQGLKDRLARSNEPEADQLRAEIADLEQHIEDLTEFSPGSEFADPLLILTGEKGEPLRLNTLLSGSQYYHEGDTPYCK